MVWDIYDSQTGERWGGELGRLMPPKPLRYEYSLGGKAHA